MKGCISRLLPVSVYLPALGPAGILALPGGHCPSFGISRSPALQHDLGVGTQGVPLPLPGFVGFQRQVRSEGQQRPSSGLGRNLDPQALGSHTGKLTPGEVAETLQVSVPSWHEAVTGLRAPRATVLALPTSLSCSLRWAGQTLGDPAPSRPSGGACPSAFLGSRPSTAPRGCLAGPQRELRSGKEVKAGARGPARRCWPPSPAAAGMAGGDDF